MSDDLHVHLSQIELLAELVEKGPLHNANIMNHQVRDTLVMHQMAVEICVNGFEHYHAATSIGVSAYKKYYDNAATLEEAKQNRRTDVWRASQSHLTEVTAGLRIMGTLANFNKDMETKVFGAFDPLVVPKE